MAGSKLSSLLTMVPVDGLVGIVSAWWLDDCDTLTKNAGPLDKIMLCCDNEAPFSCVEEQDGKDSMESEKSRSKVSLRQDERSSVSAGRGGGHGAERSKGYK